MDEYMVDREPKGKEPMPEELTYQGTKKEINEVVKEWLARRENYLGQAQSLRIRAELLEQAAKEITAFLSGESANPNKRADDNHTPERVGFDR